MPTAEQLYVHRFFYTQADLDEQQPIPEVDGDDEGEGEGEEEGEEQT
jgi:hypothetical protein